jgi:hypothetical protein
MGGVSRVPAAIEGLDGARYYAVSDAATLLGTSAASVRRSYDLFLAAGRVAHDRGPGRPPVHVVDADAVDAARAELLKNLLVRDGADAVATEELQQLRRRVRELEARYSDLLQQHALVGATADAQAQELEPLRRDFLESARAIEESR